jgi:hypothetical protein
LFVVELVSALLYVLGTAMGIDCHKAGCDETIASLDG